jgi:hypothetical protein
MRIVKISIALSLVLLLSVAGCANGEPARIAVGERAPNFELQNLDGESVSLRDFRGSVVLLALPSTDTSGVGRQRACNSSRKCGRERFKGERLSD